MAYDDRGLPREASIVIDGVSTRIATMTYDHFGRVSDTHIGAMQHGMHAHVDYDVRHRPVQAWFERNVVTPAPPGDNAPLPGDMLSSTRYPYWYHYTWDAASNLTRVTDMAGYANAGFQDGYRQRTTYVTHDSLYRVAQVDYAYRALDGQWGPHDAATDWRSERTRTNADAQTHGDVDPMDREPAQMVPALPAERVQNLTYAYDWLANMTEWTDDASSFYERSLGDVGNGAGHAGLRPSALYVATNITQVAPAPDSGVDRGGYVEVDYGEGGNVLAFTVHAQCRDASPSNVCYADDPRTTAPATVRTNLRARCVCEQDTEQHVQLRWDELNRLVEARRYDRDSGAWTLAVRQRHRYDGGNVRLIKETLDVDEADPTLRQRITLSVLPGDFERVGVYADHDALEPAYRGSAVLQAETHYQIAGARLVRARGEEAGALNPRHRLTYGLSDLIQSTSAVMDLDSGELIEATTFYPNGARETHRTTTKASVPVEPIGFTGKEEDEEVGLTYFGERWLIPRIGRWASPDPLAVHTMGGGEGANAYHYVSGALLQGRDPLGLDCGHDRSCGPGETVAPNEADTSLPDGSSVQSQNYTPGRPPPDPAAVRSRGQRCAHMNCHGAGYESASDMPRDMTREEMDAASDALAWGLAGEIPAVGFGMDVYDAATADTPIARAASAASAAASVASGDALPNRATTIRGLRALARLRAASGHADEAADAVDAAVDAERRADGMFDVDGPSGSGAQASRWTRTEVDGTRVYQRDDLFDPSAVDRQGRTNVARMRAGLAPIGVDGRSVNLHHINQDPDGSLVEVTDKMHRDYRRQIHIDLAPGRGLTAEQRRAFDAWRREYWQRRADDFSD